MREMPPADPFPVSALGVLAATARGIHERTQAPFATCGQSVLAAATLAVQGLADVELPTRQARPVSCFFVTIAGTGERKTSVDTKVLRPIRRQEADLRDEYAESLPGFQNDAMAWEKAREAAIKKAGKDRGAIKEALDAIGAKPAPPWLPVLAVSEPTYEGLCKLFVTSRPGAWLSDALLADQGLLSRVLVSAPDSTAGTRFWREWEGNGALADYDRKLFDLIRTPLSLDQAGGGVRPRALAFSPAARRAWIDFHDWREMRVRPGGEFDAIRGLANKLPEHAARLAAVLTMAADVDAGEVAAEAMESGAALARHYAAEALRLFQGAAVNDELRMAQKTLAWLKAKEKAVFYLPELYQFGPAPFRTRPRRRRS